MTPADIGNGDVGHGSLLTAADDQTTLEIPVRGGPLDGQAGDLRFAMGDDDVHCEALRLRAELVPDRDRGLLGNGRRGCGANGRDPGERPAPPRGHRRCPRIFAGVLPVISRAGRCGNAPNTAHGFPASWNS